MQIKIGTLIKDNDPRNAGRTFKVNKIERDRIGYQGDARQCWVKRDRVFTDGKKRAQGWNVVVKNEPSALADDMGIGKTMSPG